MSGLRGALRALKEAQRKEKNLWTRMANPSVTVGRTVYPKGQAAQASVGFRWDLDVAIERDDGTTVNRYELQPNAQAESSSIKAYIKRQGSKGTHSVITTVDVPQGAKDDEVQELVEQAIDAVD
jgi:hypothetical protein